eukprot:4761991-Pyramimonas_sp.AAC.1
MRGVWTALSRPAVRVCGCVPLPPSAAHPVWQYEYVAVPLPPSAAHPVWQYEYVAVSRYRHQQLTPA